MTWLDPVYPGDTLLMSGRTDSATAMVRRLGNRWTVRVVDERGLVVAPEQYAGATDLSWRIGGLGDEHFAINGVERRSAA